MVVSVILDIKHQKLNKVYDYLVKEADQELIQKGLRVIVPFTDHNIERLGLVIDVKESSSSATKYVKEVLDVNPVLDDESFLILSYLTSFPSNLLSQAVETLIPHELLMHYEKRVVLVDPSIETEIKNQFNRDGMWVLKRKDRRYYAQLKKLEKAQKIRIETILKPKVKRDYETYLYVNDVSKAFTSKQKEAALFVKMHGQIQKTIFSDLYSDYMIRALVQKGVLTEQKVLKKPHIHLKKQTNHRLDFTPNIQKKILEIDFEKAQTYLVSEGNDSFQFILASIQKVIELKKQVLVLVPERLMIEPLQKRLASNFPELNVIGLSTDKTLKQRYQDHTYILNHDAHIVIGSRSALFTQFKALGGIFILDSHDEAYVPFEGIFYDVKKLAQLRSQFHHIPVFLKSHTFTLSDVYLLRNKTYQVIEFDNQLTQDMLVIDMKEELRRGHSEMLSRKLKSMMEAALSKNNNVMLILNQKGYAPFVMCRNCSYVPQDPVTGQALNFVASKYMLRSQITKYEEPFSRLCPKCGQEAMKEVSIGIEQLYRYITKLYPKQQVYQLDKDTMQTKDVYQLIERTKEDDGVIFVGTQMALKSLFKGKIGLVAVLMADGFLKLPKYDAREIGFKFMRNAYYLARDTFIVQAYDTNHDVIQSMNDPQTFYDKELFNRKVAKLPPYNKLLQVLVMANSYLKAHQYAHRIKNEVFKAGYDILGPVDALVLKEKNAYRILLLIKYQSLNDALKQLLISHEDMKIYTNPLADWY